LVTEIKRTFEGFQGYGQEVCHIT